MSASQSSSDTNEGKSEVKLSEYAKENPGQDRRPVSWWDSIPTETQDQILDGYKSGISKATILRWLRSGDHPECTREKLKRGIDNNA